MGADETIQRKGSPRVIVAVLLIIGALYAPQSWFLFMDYAWNGYRMSWLILLPGLPTFFPVAIFSHPNDVLMIISLWCTTALLAVTLVLLSRRHPVAFWITLAFALALSVVSAFGAYGAFRA